MVEKVHSDGYIGIHLSLDRWWKWTWKLSTRTYHVLVRNPVLPLPANISYKWDNTISRNMCLNWTTCNSACCTDGLAKPLEARGIRENDRSQASVVSFERMIEWRIPLAKEKYWKYCIHVLNLFLLYFCLFSLKQNQKKILFWNNVYFEWHILFLYGSKPIKWWHMALSLKK